jgi:hypothetical protein
MTVLSFYHDVPIRHGQNRPSIQDVGPLEKGGGRAFKTPEMPSRRDRKVNTIIQLIDNPGVAGWQKIKVRSANIRTFIFPPGHGMRGGIGVDFQ